MRAQSKHVNHSDKHGRGIRPYKLRSVPLAGKCHLLLHAVLSDLEFLRQADRQLQTHLG